MLRSGLEAVRSHRRALLQSCSRNRNRAVGIDQSMQDVPEQPAAHGDGDGKESSGAAPWRTLRVSHDTRYRYSARVEYAQHQSWLRPRGTPRQQVLDFALDVKPGPDLINTGLATFGNQRYSFALDTPHEELLARSSSLVRVRRPELAAAPRGERPAMIVDPSACNAS